MNLRRMGSRLLPRVVVLGVLATVGCPAPDGSPPPAPVPAETELVSPALEGRMAEAGAAIEQRGFAEAGEPMRSFLVEQAAMIRSVSLPTGRCQVFVALGSSALRELAIGIYESAGTELASARGAGTGVAVRYCPDRPGTHYVAVRALEGDGLVAAKRFEGPAGIAVDLGDLFPPPEAAPAEAVRP